MTICFSVMGGYWSNFLRVFQSEIVWHFFIIYIKCKKWRVDVLIHSVNQLRYFNKVFFSKSCDKKIENFRFRMDLLSMEQIADKIYRSYLLVFFILSYGFLQKLVKKKWFYMIQKDSKTVRKSKDCTDYLIIHEHVCVYRFESIPHVIFPRYPSTVTVIHIKDAM